MSVGNQVWSARLLSSSAIHESSMAVVSIVHPEFGTVLTVLKRSLQSLCSFVYVLYLVTSSDLVSVLCPGVLYGVLSCLSGTLLLTKDEPHLFAILQRLPQMLIWIWLNLLVLCLANQRLPASVSEDAVNKPWRPLPSGRLTSTRARTILMLAIPVTSAASLVLGGSRETLVLFALNWIYNDLDAANDHYLARNLLNGLGITCISAGASLVGCESACEVTMHGYHWWFIVATTIGTTVQIQDLYDQEGDKIRGRSTMPLILGDATTRWSVASMVLVWSIAIPLYWQTTSLVGSYVPLVLASTMAYRLLLLRSVGQDRGTFKVWVIWMVSLYAIPWAKASGW